MDFFFMPVEVKCGEQTAESRVREIEVDSKLTLSIKVPWIVPKGNDTYHT